MIRTERGGYWELIKVSVPYFIVSMIYGTLILIIEEQYGDHIYKISSQLGSVFGFAVAFFLGFRMNSAYDRWWEARKVIGELNNNTKSMVSRMYIYFQEETYLKADIEYSSGKIIFQSLTEMMKTYIERLTTDLVHPSTANVQQTSSTTPDLLLTISFTIEKVMNSQASLEKIDLLQHINRFYDIQGKAERIKNTPFLKIYSAFTRIIVVTYVILIPFFLGDIDLGGEHSHWEYLAVPIMAAISTLFLTINHLANRYGEPFTAKMTSIPVVAIKNKIIAYITNVQLLNN